MLGGMTCCSILHGRRSVVVWDLILGLVINGDVSFRRINVLNSLLLLVSNCLNDCLVRFGDCCDRTRVWARIRSTFFNQFPHLLISTHQ